MKSRTSESTMVRLNAAIPLLLAAMAGPFQLAAQEQPTYKVLHAFSGGTDGSNPMSLAGDGKGNFYGMTFLGGDFSCGFGGGCGVVFKVDVEGTETVKWAFTGGADGYCISCSSEVAPDNEGNLYGGSLGGTIGAGLVFKIDRGDHLIPLYNFKGGTDGVADFALTTIRDNEGNIYGTTDGGGSLALGVVFKLDPKGNETVLHSFTGGTDGEYPYSGLVRDKKGDVYGTTFLGGSNGAGVIYKVGSQGGENVLYTFTASSTGSNAPLLLDKAGDLYGTTPGGGGIFPPGFVFKLDPKDNFTVLYTFTGGADGGGASDGRLVQDKAGNFYGTTQVGGNLACPQFPGGGCGVVFKLDPSGHETVLYNFCSQPNCADGAFPYPANLVLEEVGSEGEQLTAAGGEETEGSQNRGENVIRLYGIAANGGNVSGGCAPSGCGVVFELTVPQDCQSR